MVFVIDNQNNYPTKLSVRGSDTRSKNQSYLPIVNHSCWQWGVSCCAMKIFSHFPKDVKNLRSDKMKFKIELHNILLFIHSVYLLNSLKIIQVMYIIHVLISYLFLI